MSPGVWYDLDGGPARPAAKRILKRGEKGMRGEVQIQKVLAHWALRDPRVEGQPEARSPRLLCRIGTDSGRFILKGFPGQTPESTIRSNVRAHLFLSGGKDLAPRVFPLKTGAYYVSEQGYWFYLMECIEGRQMAETPEDEYRLGRAARELHVLRGYPLRSPWDQSKERFYGWFRDRPFVREFDAILDALPDFEKLDQCMIHSDLGPHNAMLRQDGRVILIDLDDAGLGSRYLDLGWPFIMQFVDFNHDTEEMKYRFDLAVSFLKGYCGDAGMTREAYDLLFSGAVQTHISYMQSYGPDAVDSLWRILNYGMEQKEALWSMLRDAWNAPEARGSGA